MATKLASLQVAYGDEEMEQAQAGFDYWFSFRRQGVYNDPTFNINGQQSQSAEGAILPDRTTDYAVEWLESNRKRQPFFSLPIPIKAVHADFTPAEGAIKGPSDKLQS